MSTNPSITLQVLVYVGRKLPREVMVSSLGDIHSSQSHSILLDQNYKLT